jgi:hypothetical protein
MGKVGVRMFKKALNGRGLYFTEDGFLSNGHWAIRDFLLKQAINKKIDLRTDKIVSELINMLEIKELVSNGPWVMNKNIMERVVKEVNFYDNFKLVESKKYAGFYELDNIIEDVKDKFLINKTYYDFISQIIPLSRCVARVVKRTSYLIYDDKEEFYNQDYDLIFFWYPKYSIYDDLKSVLAVCMPALKR